MIDAISTSPQDLRVLLLEGINESAVDLFRAAGFRQIERLTKALGGSYLNRALAVVLVLASRAGTQ